MLFPSIHIKSAADPGQGEGGKLAFWKRLCDGYLTCNIQAVVYAARSLQIKNE